MISHNYKFNPLFYHERNPYVRYVIITGGRFSSKSFTASKAVCRLVNDIGHRALYCRYTLSSAKDSIIPEFQEKIDMFGLTNYYKSTSDRIECLDGKRKIVFKGIKTSAGNQSAKLKSLKDFSIFVLDEAEEENDESSFDKIDLSIRASDVPNICILVYNPPTKEHWTYKRFFESKGIDETYNGIIGDTAYIHTTYEDCIDFVPPDYLRSINELKIRDPQKYRHIIEGRYLDKAEGVIYKNWKYGEFDNELPYGFGMDFGFFPDPDVLVKVAINKKERKIYVKEEFGCNELPTIELVERTKQIVGRSLVVADSAGKRSIEDLRMAGIRVEKAYKPAGSIEAGISLLQDYEIIVDPKSIEIGKELNNYCLKNGKPIDAYNHRLDAIRYYVDKSVSKRTNGIVIY